MKEDKELTVAETKEKALRLLEFRSHSEAELRTKLERAGGVGIDEVIEFCHEYKFLNDADYAFRLSRDLLNLKKYGKRRIKDELKNRGIDNELCDAAISELEVDEKELLMPQIEKKIGKNFDKKNLDKTIRYFLYRGYGFSDIKQCIDSLREVEDEYGI